MTPTFTELKKHTIQQGDNLKIAQLELIEAEIEQLILIKQRESVTNIYQNLSKTITENGNKTNKRKEH